MALTRIRSNRTLAGRGILLLGLLASLLIVPHLLAAGDFGFEAEDGTVSGQASTAMDGTASGGRYLQFASGGTITLPSGGTWTNITGNLPNAWRRVFDKPGSSEVIGHVSDNLGIYSNTGNNTWTRIGQGSGSVEVSGGTMHMTFDPANPNTFWISTMYGSRGIYRTTNGGQTFQALGNISHNDFVSIDFSDPNRQTILAGGHEQKKTVWKSSNGGQTWTNIGANIPGNPKFSSHPVIINSQTYIVDGEDNSTDGELGIWRTTNGGSSWSKVSTEGVSGSPLLSTKGYLYFRGGNYWSASSNFLLRSKDDGATWQRVTVPNFTIAPIELPDGRLVAPSTSRLHVSSDDGDTWTAFGANIPCRADNIAYSSGQDAFYFHGWDNYCGGDRSVYRLK